MSINETIISQTPITSPSTLLTKFTLCNLLNNKCIDPRDITEINSTENNSSSEDNTYKIYIQPDAIILQKFQSSNSILFPNKIVIPKSFYTFFIPQNNQSTIIINIKNFYSTQYNIQLQLYETDINTLIKQLQNPIQQPQKPQHPLSSYNIINSELPQNPNPYSQNPNPYPTNQPSIYSGINEQYPPQQYPQQQQYYGGNATNISYTNKSIQFGGKRIQFKNIQKINIKNNNMTLHLKTKTYNISGNKTELNKFKRFFESNKN